MCPLVFVCPGPPLLWASLSPPPSHPLPAFAVAQPRCTACCLFAARDRWLFATKGCAPWPPLPRCGMLRAAAGRAAIARAAVCGLPEEPAGECLWPPSSDAEEVRRQNVIFATGAKGVDNTAILKKDDWKPVSSPAGECPLAGR